jgi:hypothetical protein
MTSDRKPGPILLIAALAIVAGRSLAQAPTTRDSLEFSQKKVRANMEELEERMFRLANLLREAQPESSARLVLGLKRSREDLIVAEMDQTRALIAAGRLEEATEHQRAILVKLEELRKLLLSADLDLILKLERLRQLTRVNKALNELKKEEDRQAEALDKLGDQAADEQKQMQLDAMREAADEAARKLEETAADAQGAMPQESGVSGEIEAARGDESAARQDLSKGEAKSAAGKKRKAGSKIGQASGKVSSAREQLLDELQDPIRAAVIDALNQMVEHQRRVKEGMPAADAGQPPAGWNSLRDLERGVVDLARSTRDLVEETEFSVALPPALRVTEAYAAASAAKFAGSAVDAETRRVGGRLMDDLEGLLKILLDEAAGAKRAGKRSEGGCKGCADRNKLISELSTVRLLELGLREDTRAADSRRQPEAAQLAAEIQVAVRALGERQNRTSKATVSLKNQSCSRCLGTEDE